METAIENFKPYRRIIFAILLQAVQDLKSGDEGDAESARRFLQQHGAAYLSAAGITHPEKKLRQYLEEPRSKRERRPKLGSNLGCAA